jgi:hypothetical protein
MNPICVLCKNKNDFNRFVKFFQESYEEISQNNLVNNPEKYAYVHLKCACLYPDLEVAIYRHRLPQNPELALVKDFAVEVLIYNGKNLREGFNQECSICNNSIPRYVLIPCLAK